MNINYNVLHTIGKVFLANDAFYQAQLAFNNALKFKRNPEAYFYAGLTYFLIGTKENNKEFLKKAEGYFSKCYELDKDMWEAQYYKAIILIKLEEENKAQNVFLDLWKREDIDEFFRSSIKPFVNKAMLRAEMESYAYDVLRDPFLASYYEAMKEVFINSFVIKRLKKAYDLDENPFLALAYGIDKAYKEVANEIQNANPIERFVVLTIVLADPSIGINEAIQIAKNKEWKKLKLTVRAIVNAFYKIFHIDPNTKMPYLIEKDMSNIKHLIDILCKLTKKEIDVKKAKYKLNILPILPERLNDLLNEINEKQSIIELLYPLYSLIKAYIELLYQRVSFFYAKRTALSIIKSIITSSKLDTNVKLDLMTID